jgi:hypothetical protein
MLALGLWFHPTCLQALEVSLSGSRFMFRYALVTPRLLRSPHRPLPRLLHMLLALASLWHTMSGIIVIRLSL